MKRKRFSPTTNVLVGHHVSSKWVYHAAISGNPIHKWAQPKERTRMITPSYEMYDPKIICLASQMMNVLVNFKIKKESTRNVPIEFGNSSLTHATLFHDENTIASWWKSA